MSSSLSSLLPLRRFCFLYRNPYKIKYHQFPRGSSRIRPPPSLLLFRRPYSSSQKSNKDDKDGGFKARLRQAFQAILLNTKESAMQTMNRFISPPDEPPPDAHSRSQHTLGYKLLAGSSFISFGALCYYGIFHPDGYASAMNRHDQWPQHVKQRVRQTFGYFGLSATITALSTFSIFKSRTFMRLVHAAPWAVFVTALSLQIITGVIVLLQEYHPGNWITLKDVLWVVHCATMGITVAPMCYVGGRMVIRSFLMTGGVVGALSLLAFCAPEKSFISWSFPLGMGLGVVFASSIGSFLYPQTTRVGINLFSFYLYGGMLLFCGMLLLDTQRVLRRAEWIPLQEEGEPRVQIHGDPFDPINGAMAMYIDCLNVFVRFIQLFALKHVRTFKW